MKKIKIARIVTVPEAFVHFKTFLSFLAKNDQVELTLISSDGRYRQFLKENIGVDITPINIEREISWGKDFKSLMEIIFYFFKNQYTIVHSSTPKAGLITAIAGFCFPKMVRIHTFTGQRWATFKGFKRKIFKFLDRLIIKLNTQCYADSPSQIEFLISEKVAFPGELKCLNLGSYGGIDTERFDHLKYPEARNNLLKEISASDSSIILLYVGRITKDKGIEELVESFLLASFLKPELGLELVLVGPYEQKLDALSDKTLKQINDHKKIHHLGFKTNPEYYFSGADIFCLPSFREGFGTVVLEAAACNLLTLGTKIPGLVDSVVDQETGILVEKKNVEALVEALKEAIIKLASDKALREKLGTAARLRARKEFDSHYMAKLQWEEYQLLINLSSK